MNRKNYSTEQARSDLLEACGRSFQDIVRSTVYLMSMADFAAMNDVYAMHFKAPYPARITIALSALPLGATVEIDVIVATDEGR